MITKPRSMKNSTSRRVTLSPSLIPPKMGGGVESSSTKHEGSLEELSSPATSSVFSNYLDCTMDRMGFVILGNSGLTLVDVFCLFFPLCSSTFTRSLIPSSLLVAMLLFYYRLVPSDPIYVCAILTFVCVSIFSYALNY